MPEIQISQSLIKDRRKVINGQMCGRVFRAKWIDRDWKDEPSEAMRIGQCFEYWATGQRNYHDEIPEPDYVYKGTPKEKLSAAFERAFEAAEAFKRFCNDLNIRITETGRKVVVGDLRATVDVEADVGNVPSVIDLKYSGLIGNRWEELGWDTGDFGQIEFSAAQREYHGLQAHFNSKLTGKPFYFWIFSSGNDRDSRLVQVELTDETRARFDLEIEETREWLHQQLNSVRGFSPFPRYVECRDCQLKHSCPAARLFPKIETITI